MIFKKRFLIVAMRSAALLTLFTSVSPVAANEHESIGALPTPYPSITMPQGVSLDSSQQSQINAIARQIYEKMKTDSGGDPEKMQVLLRQFSANPQQLFQSMTPEQKKNIDALTQSVLRKQGAAPTSGSQKTNENNAKQ